MSTPTPADTISAIWGCVDRDGEMDTQEAEAILIRDEQARRRGEVDGGVCELTAILATKHAMALAESRRRIAELEADAVEGQQAFDEQNAAWSRTMEQLAATVEVVEEMRKALLAVRQFFAARDSIVHIVEAALAKADTLLAHSPACGLRCKHLPVTAKERLAEADALLAEPAARSEDRAISLYHCSGCGKEKRRNYCLKCGTFNNTATNEIQPAEDKARGGGR